MPESQHTTLASVLAQADRLRQRLQEFRPMNELSLRSLRAYYRVGLTYTSNALEGNSLTESETKVVIEDGLTVEGHPLREIYEATGHAQAYDFMHTLVAGQPLTEEAVLTLHRLFYQQIAPQHAGSYRKVPVFISGSQYAVTPAERVGEEVRRLVDWYNGHEATLHPVLLAAHLHKRFVFIHPFIDGNGRVARLLMNLALVRGGYDMAIVPPLLRAEYIAHLEHAHTDDVPFQIFVAERVVATQTDLLRLLGEVNGGVNTAGGGVSGGVSGMPGQVLALLASQPKLRAPQIASELGWSLRTTQRQLQQLTHLGLIRFDGAPRNGGYIIVKE